MRIIDKNTDFYDYYQNIYRDDTFTFDRRDSYILTKEIMCTYLYAETCWNWKKRIREYKTKNSKYVLLQICNTFWLFLIEFDKIDNYGQATDYDIKLLTKWRNFNKPRKLCSLDIIRFPYFSIEDDTKIETLVNAINRNDYKNKKNLNAYTIYNGDTKVEKHIPLLKACGIANCINAHEVYLAFEEYFSLEKSSSERREPLGISDIDKVESHGFDKKTSFRGKI